MDTAEVLAAIETGEWDDVLPLLDAVRERMLAGADVGAEEAWQVSYAARDLARTARLAAEHADAAALAAD